jgi:hypothetical protein
VEMNATEGMRTFARGMIARKETVGELSAAYGTNYTVRSLTDEYEYVFLRFGEV